MATIKSYTDLQQSKKLAKILPLESADMSYSFNFDSEIYEISTTSYKSWVVPKYAQPDNGFGQVIPCWSLAALLKIIPKPDLVQNSEGTWLIHSWVNAYPWSVGGYSNPVDACVAMIEKLKELNLL